MQRNLTKIEGNVRELEAKLKHEQDKFKTYNKDLKEAEKRYICRPASVYSLVCESVVYSSLFLPGFSANAHQDELDLLLLDHSLSIKITIHHIRIHLVQVVLCLRRTAS